MRAVHQIKYNKSDRNGTPIKYIVVHDTGNPSRGANATAHYNYFNGGNRNASADFFVDDTQIICVTIITSIILGIAETGTENTELQIQTRSGLSCA